MSEDEIRQAPSSPAAHPMPPPTSMDPSKPEEGKPRSLKNDVFLGFCRLVNVATGFSALLCLVAHALAVAAGPSFSVSAVTAITMALLQPYQAARAGGRPCAVATYPSGHC